MVGVRFAWRSYGTPHLKTQIPLTSERGDTIANCNWLSPTCVRGNFCNSLLDHVRNCFLQVQCTASEKGHLLSSHLSAHKCSDRLCLAKVMSGPQIALLLLSAADEDAQKRSGYKANEPSSADAVNPAVIKVVLSNSCLLRQENRSHSSFTTLWGFPLLENSNVSDKGSMFANKLMTTNVYI